MNIWETASLVDIGADDDDLWLGAQIVPITRDGGMGLVDGDGADGTGILRRSADGFYDPQCDFLIGLSGSNALFAHLYNTEHDPQVGPHARGEMDGKSSGVEVPFCPKKLREVLSLVDDLDAEIAMRAAALVAFHTSNEYCPSCGGLTTTTDWGRSRLCQACGTQHFPRTDPAVITLVTDGDRILLGHHVGWEPSRRSIFAGFIEAGESAEQAVLREIREEIGMTVTDVRYVSSQPWPMPRSLMLGFTARGDGDPRPDGEEITSAQWYTRAELAEAVATGRVMLPVSASIAYRMIQAWKDGTSSGKVMMPSVL